MKLPVAVAVLTATLAGAVVAQGAPKVRSVTRGGTFTVSGRTGSPTGARRSTGRVVMSGRWNGGAWRVVASSHTNARGRYRLSITVHRRGTLHLRVTPPDGDDHSFVLRVL
jgi:large exoprotein involved in heme utilization and adhesion